ncbi:MAG: histone deacetylase family protein, partial [Rhodospirillales bacterium]|nr:histone deacetylase family protein [Rhodospirillales bacterium]
DVHHGNGTQDIFYDRSSVLTVSIHADPDEFYPFYWGHKNERGKGRGKGANINYPLAVGSGEGVWLQTMKKALGRIRKFKPDILFVSLGLDAYEHDPLGGLKVSTQGFAEAGKRIGAIDLPIVLVQEGGYISDALSTNLQEFLLAFQQARPAAPA